MRILHIITSLKQSGSENHLLELTSGLKAYGITSFVFTLKRKPDDLLTQFSQSGTSVHCITRISDYPKIFKVLKTSDFIHAHLWPSEVLAFLISTLARKKWIITKHNRSDIKIPYIGRSLTRYLLKQSAGNIYISNSAKEFYGTFHKNHRVIHYGYSSGNHSEGLRLRQDDSLRLGFLGRLEEVKNIPALLRSVQRLQSMREFKISLTIAGDGPLRQELDDYILENDLSNVIQLIGFLTEVSSFYKNIDCLVLPSFTEGFGLVVLEAMSRGIPVIVSDGGALPEIVDKKELVFDLNKEGDLDRKIRYLSDPLNYYKSSSYVLNRIQDFGLNKMYSATYEFYQSVNELGKKNG